MYTQGGREVHASLWVPNHRLRCHTCVPEAALPLLYCHRVAAQRLRRYFCTAPERLWTMLLLYCHRVAAQRLRRYFCTAPEQLWTPQAHNRATDQGQPALRPTALPSGHGSGPCHPSCQEAECRQRYGVNHWRTATNCRRCKEAKPGRADREESEGVAESEEVIYSDHTAVIQWSYSGLQCFCSGLTVVLQWSYGGLQCFCSGLTVVLQWSYGGLQWSYSGLQWSYSGPTVAYIGPTVVYSGLTVVLLWSTVLLARREESGRQHSPTPCRGPRQPGRAEPAEQRAAQPRSPC
jgi:hypothetical protein